MDLTCIININEVLPLKEVHYEYRIINIILQLLSLTIKLELMEKEHISRGLIGSLVVEIQRVCDMYL